MKFTNEHNLPDPMVAAMTWGYPPKSGTLSVSSMIGPPRIRTLTMKHWDSMVDDVSNRLWALLGQGLHAVLSEHSKGKEVLAEQGIKSVVKIPNSKLPGAFLEITVSGRPDFYGNGVINDYKITSVFSFLLGDKPEWESQLNVYAFLFRSAGFPVTELNIQAILRDWTESKALADKDYPPIPFITVPVPLWTPGDAEQYVNDRIRLHIEHPMDPCTPIDRWAKPATFAVMKKGGKRALRVLDTLKEAQEWGAKHHEEKPKDELEIHERKGADVRCERYCPVRQFCDQNQYNNAAVAGNDDEESWEEME